MGTSAVTLDGHGFWSPDGLLEIFAWLLADRLPQDRPWARRYADHLRVQATAGLTGTLDFKLSSLDEEARRELAEAIDAVVALAEREPERLGAPALNEAGLGGGAVFRDGIDSERLRRLAAAFKDLIGGRWRWTPADAEALPREWLTP